MLVSLDPSIANTPMQLHKTHGTTLSEPIAHKTHIGRLLYLTHSRPEIACAVSKLSQFLDALTDKH